MEKATREQTKQHNTQLVLRTIYQQSDISRADIARTTRLTRPTVSSIVAELLDQHLVAETGQGPSAGGKPPTLLSIAQNSYQLVCVDLGGSTFRGAITNLRGEIRQQIDFPVVPGVRHEALEQVIEFIDRLVAVATAPILGIAIGTPGLIDPEQGIVRRAVNLEWTDLPLRRLLEERYDRPVYLANDSQLAALAEYTFGRPRDSDNLMLIKIEQGIGAGIVLDGQIYYGDGLGAGEIGHLVVAANGMCCTCGNVGCLETTSSTRAILRQAREIAHGTPDGYLAGVPAITVDTLQAALGAGDPATRQLLEEAGRYLGVAIAALIVSFNIHNVVISSQISRFGDVLLDAARAAVRHRALPSLAACTDIQYATLGRDIVTLGGSAMILKHELGVI